MHFLVSQNLKKRLLLQVDAYQNTSFFKWANRLTQIDLFWLEKQELSLQNIHTLEMPKKLRLGNRLEYFFEWLVNKNPRYQIITKSIQVVENKKTLGELDFLVLDKKNTTIIHVEIANKFYLYDQKIASENERWIGPNRNDSLVQKCEKMKTKQFPLCFHKRTQKIIEEKNIDVSKVVQQLNFKAQLFLPFGKELILEEEILKNVKGFYISLKIFKTEVFKSYEYFIPEKQDWLVDPKHGEIWSTHLETLESILLHFEDKKSPLVWVKKPDKSFEKMFVVWW